jgi:hypothetical protein
MYSNNNVREGEKYFYLVSHKLPGRTVKFRNGFVYNVIWIDFDLPERLKNFYGQNNHPIERQINIC